ncbi:MAG: S1C family serine protease [Nitrososphaeraceae archaeon]
MVTLITINYSMEDSLATEDFTNKTQTLSELFKNVEKSVVQISSEDETTELLGSRLGSGFVYDKNGHVVTNNHVTSGGKDLHVTFSDGTIYTGKVIGSDPHSDLAILLIDDVPKEKLFPLTLGNSSNLIVGETVAAVGNPFGLSGSLTEGIISGLGRLLPSTPENIFGSDPRVATFSIPDIIQTDAAINPGNSGGPLLNLKGEVIGINSAIFSNTGVYAGVGFAIPSNTLKKVIPELLKNGSYPHPWLGITGVDVTPDIAKKMNLTEARGFLVIDVNSNGPADKAGIRGGYIVEIINNTQYRLGGDVIIGIDNQTINSVSDITDYLKNTKEGDIVKLKILRDNKMINVPVNLEIITMPLDQPDEIPPFNGNPKDFGDDQGKFTEQLKKECLLNFNESICNFLFR